MNRIDAHFQPEDGHDFQEITVEDSFSLQDIQSGIRNAQDLYGIHIQEEDDNKTSQRDLLRKYSELSILSQFLKTFDPGVLDNVAAVNEYLNAQNDFRDELEDNQAAMMESRDQ